MTAYNERALLNAETLNKVKRYIGTSDLSDLKTMSPSVITLDLCWNCNLNCLNCIDTKARDGTTVVHKAQCKNPLKTKKDEKYGGPFLPWSAAKSVIEYASMPTNNVRGLQLMGGETLLYPEIDKFLDLAAEKEVTLELVTNGTLMLYHIETLTRAFSTPNSKIRVSINGWNSYVRRVDCGKIGKNLREQVIEGIRQLVAAFQPNQNPPIFVSTVAFDNALKDLDDIVVNLKSAGINRLLVIRERNAMKKEFIKSKKHTLDRVKNRVEEIIGRYPNFYIGMAENITVTPIPQPKLYTPCPATFLKTLVGADGWLYTCPDHRGCEYARLVNLEEFEFDFAKAWESKKRISGTLSNKPEKNCSSLVCQRYEANIKLWNLRNKAQEIKHEINEIHSRDQASWSV